MGIACDSRSSLDGQTPSNSLVYPFLSVAGTYSVKEQKTRRYVSVRQIGRPVSALSFGDDYPVRAT